jgi:hypothetical protein
VFIVGILGKSIKMVVLEHHQGIILFLIGIPLDIPCRRDYRILAFDCRDLQVNPKQMSQFMKETNS